MSKLSLIEKRDALLAKANKIAEQHAKIAEQVGALNTQIDAEAKLANLKAGDRVDAVVGRGEKARTLANAQVLGSATDENGTKYRVVTGSGFETEVHVLTAGQITAVYTQEELEAAAAQVVEEVAE